MDQAGGSLPSKALKLASLLESAAEFREAQTWTICAVSCCIATSVSLRAEGEGEGGRSLSNKSDSVDTSLCQSKLALDRLLRLEARQHIGLPEGLPYYDNKSLNDVERYFLLESQLKMLFDNGESKTLSQIAKSAGSMLCEVLLSLHEKDECARSEARLMLLALCINAKSSIVTKPSLLLKLDTCIRRLSVSTSILDQHLHASLMLALSLQNMPPDEAILRSCLSTWQDLVVGIEFKSLLSSRDMEIWILQLQSLSELCEAQNLTELCLTTLLLLQKTFSNTPTSNVESNAVVRTRIAQNLLTYGYSEDAGLQLHKAKAELGGIAEAFDINFDLTQSEYYLALGQYDQWWV